MDKKAVFLDRDGVINETLIKKGKPSAPFSFDEFKILPNIKESIYRLKKMNYLCLVVTNQPDVRRGLVKKSTVEKMNISLKKEINVDDIFVCYHDDLDNCNCRKPKPGLLLDAGKKWNVNFKKSFMIGDRWKDIEAGKSAGCETIYLDYKYQDKQPEKPNFITDTLINAVCFIERKNI
tara:strand:+ start:509 stop:1042 length:534 start_codon:yes stop_codon:yes gene_type:complete